jgi:dihydrofolate synthase/folylpolyglutamate synthase
MSYADALKFLYGLRLFGVKFGLENTFKLAALAGYPQNQLRFIHVAGTNGKGSTCAMLESIFRAAGWRVGLFTSPHLVSFTERLQVNRQPITEADVARLVAGLQPLLQQFPPDAHPTFFEVVTVMALRYFAEQRCNLVIWEAGLGGRLDATNIVTPLASVITPIGLDHQQWLGGTVEKIAFEKAGIIKPRVPVITGAAPGHGLEVIAEVSRRRQAPLTIVAPAEADRPPLDTIALPLPGRHQRQNAALALATIRALGRQFNLAPETIAAGLARVQWPGRFQVVKTGGGQTLLLDGAHNPDGAAALAATLRQEFPDTPPAMILGVFQDKDWRAMCATLAPLARRLVLTRVNSERSLDPAELLSACRFANPAAPAQLCPSLAEALALTSDEPLALVTGSLYLVGEALERLHLTAVPRADERGLNEWTSPAPVPAQSAC